MSDATPTAPTPREVHNEPWRLLATLPSTNFKMLSGVVLTWATCVQFFALQWAGRDAKIVSGLWDSWLIFVGSIVGVAAAQYAWKRKTYDPHGPEAQRAAASEPGPEAEAVRERGTTVETMRVVAESGATPVPVVVPTQASANVLPSIVTGFPRPAGLAREPVVDAPLDVPGRGD